MSKTVLIYNSRLETGFHVGVFGEREVECLADNEAFLNS